MTSSEHQDEQGPARSTTDAPGMEPQALTPDPEQVLRDAAQGLLDAAVTLADCLQRLLDPAGREETPDLDERPFVTYHLDRDTITESFYRAIAVHRLAGELQRALDAADPPAGFPVEEESGG